MGFLHRVGTFLRRYLVKHPLYVVVYGWLHFQDEAVSGVKLYTTEEVSDVIVSGKSLIRFGDGEINLLLSLPNHYQPFSPRAQEMLATIIANYSSESPYVLAVPRFINVSNQELKQMGKFNVWLPLKAMFALRFPKKVAYMDAHNFYYDTYFDTVVGPLLTGRQVVLVTNESTIQKQKSNPRLPWSDFSGVVTPEQNSLGEYAEIKRRIDEHLAMLPKDPRKKPILLFALGPVGKYLTYEYALSGVQSLDIGKVAEVMYTGESIEWMI